MRIRQVLIISFLICSSVLAQTYYVDPVAGLDTNPGTIGLPLKTIGAANTKVGNAGGYIYLRGGTYSYSGELALSKVASAGSTIKIWAYNNEIPVIDFAGESVGSGLNGINLSGDYYHLKGLEIMYADHNGIKCTGHYNTIEACKIHSNKNSGFQFDGGTNHNNYASHNLILNTDSYLNFDPPIGGNADGFSLKWYIGKGNVCRGCRAWQNSDDGWDLWMADSTIELDSCFSFRNGVNSWGSSTFDGNGNGFKLGGNYVATPHIVKNCVSFDNAGNTGRGYDENNDTAGQTLYNCVAYRNMGDNYHFMNNPITGQHIIKNCISYIGNVSIINAILSNNSWPSLTPTAIDFVSLDTSLAVVPRQANGNLPDNGFFRLKAGSKFIDAGVYVGIPFMGSAPDIGAFEYINTLPVELSSFAAAAQGRTVVLNWSTETEKNSYRYEVERSLAASADWITVGSVKAAGMSNSPKDYKYTDNKLQSGKYQYRLKMVDNDGTFSYSKVETAEVAIPKDFAVSQNYPNPFNPSTKIDYQVPVDAKVVMEVYNIAGQRVFELVNQEQSAGYYTVDFGATKLASGVYIYRLAASDLATGNNFSSIKKMMLIK